MQIFGYVSKFPLTLRSNRGTATTHSYFLYVIMVWAVHKNDDIFFFSVPVQGLADKSIIHNI